MNNSVDSLGSSSVSSVVTFDVSSGFWVGRSLGGLSSTSITSVEWCGVVGSVESVEGDGRGVTYNNNFLVEGRGVFFKNFYKFQLTFTKTKTLQTHLK